MTRQSANALTKDILTGSTLFFSCYYVLSANPVILGQAGVPVSAALLGTLIVIIVGNISGALLTNTGLIIAPALGISAFFTSYITNSASLTWNHGLLATAVAGLLIIITSFFSSWRSTIVNDLPTPITMGIKATIGSLLVVTGFDLMESHIDQGLINQQRLIVIMGIAISITLGMITLRKHYQQQAASDWLITLLSLEHVVAVIFVVSMLHWQAPELMAQYQQPTNLSWVFLEPAFLNTRFTFEQLMTCVPLILTLWFIVITDIPGTPPMVLPEATLKKNRQQFEERGFKNDSIFTFLSPLLGTTPTIYYAENQLLTESNRFGRTIGFTVSALFTLCLVVLLLSQFTNIFSVSLESIIPPLAVAPVLLYVGLFVIANSFLQNEKNKKSAMTNDFRFYLPAALAVILTPRIGSEYSFPLTILSYWLTGSYRQEKAKISFVIISWGAVLVLLIRLALTLLE